MDIESLAHYRSIAILFSPVTGRADIEGSAFRACWHAAISRAARRHFDTDHASALIDAEAMASAAAFRLDAAIFWLRRCY